jgi:hypothetical protein
VPGIRWSSTRRRSSRATSSGSWRSRTAGCCRPRRTCSRGRSTRRSRGRTGPRRCGATARSGRPGRRHRRPPAGPRRGGRARDRRAGGRVTTVPDRGAAAVRAARAALVDDLWEIEATPL